jgi:dihydroorotate dehydrogenase electron transfer subunit
MEIGYLVQKVNNPVYMKGEITESKKTGLHYHRLRISLPQPIGSVVPGQFAMLSMEGDKNVFLPRPFSIYNFDKDEDASQLDFIFDLVGKGTELLGKLSLGSNIKILAPLGRGFPDPPSGYKILCIAGGIGIAPLFPLVLRLSRFSSSLQLFYGAKSQQDLICLPDLLTVKGVTIATATEDGTCGEKGIVTNLLKYEEDYAREKTAIYACGPELMLKLVADFAAVRKLPCWISIERLMACGVGACLSCVIRTTEGYKCCCKDGPIFSSKDIRWKECAKP